MFTTEGEEKERLVKDTDPPSTVGHSPSHTGTQPHSSYPDQGLQPHEYTDHGSQPHEYPNQSSQPHEYDSEGPEGPQPQTYNTEVPPMPLPGELPPASASQAHPTSSSVQSLKPASPRSTDRYISQSTSISASTTSSPPPPPSSSSISRHMTSSPPMTSSSLSRRMMSSPLMTSSGRQAPSPSSHPDYPQSYDVEDERDRQEHIELYSDSDSPGSIGEHSGSKRPSEFVPDDQKDDTYWEKRRKNNAAARKSREKRRIQDIVLEGRINCLEDDNSKLRRELLMLKKRFNVPDNHVISKEEEMVESRSELTTRPSSDQRMERKTSSPRMTNRSPLPSSTAPIFSPAQHSNASSLPYNTPPPLHSIKGSMSMAATAYSDATPGLPYFLSDTSSTRVSQDPEPKPPLPPVPVRSTSPGQNHSHLNHPHQLAHNLDLSSHHHQRSQASLYLQHHGSYNPAVEFLKEEPMEEGEVRTGRERSNSSIENRRPNYQTDLRDNHHLRRGSVGSFQHYRPRPGSPTSYSRSPHLPYPPHMNNARTSLRYFSPVVSSAAFDTFTPSLRHSRSPMSSASSEDNYDEPLQLTVKGGTTHKMSDQSQSIHHLLKSQHLQYSQDDSSRESEPVLAHQSDKPSSVSPPASSYPLKMRHKIPTSHELPYTQNALPKMESTAPVFPPHGPFMNGLGPLTDMALAQSNPLALLKSENPPFGCGFGNPHVYKRSRKDFQGSPLGNGRVGMRRSSGGEQKYMDPKYLERRRRNNEAARKCRENRKALTKLREAKSDYLETENSKLRDELNSLQEEMKQLRELIEKKRMEQGIKEEPNSEL